MLKSKPMVPVERPPIDIGYKYNTQKVLYFIVIDNLVSTQTGLPYSYKHTDQFTNIAIFPVVYPIVMSNFFLMFMRLTPTTNQGSLIWRWVSSGLLSMVVYGYV